MAGIDYKRSEQEKKVKYTICDVHREIYHYVKESTSLSQEEKNYLTDKVKIAFQKGKHMSAKLSQYAYGKDQEWFEREKKSWNWTELTEE